MDGVVATIVAEITPVDIPAAEAQQPGGIAKITTVVESGIGGQFIARKNNRGGNYNNRDGDGGGGHPNRQQHLQRELSSQVSSNWNNGHRAVREIFVIAASQENECWQEPPANGGGYSGRCEFVDAGMTAAEEGTLI
ncbi:DEAD box ATP-dependent RNA helicase [Culex quinquefasciatus]|uniref:DEAD box ATP-dependent RNA helicase n=1 Tax=Culex quinquefasciatus TaxID=7176 RepID=B0X0V4_CULQU|nr:DEAD box ATP-dependent RNA helicase [Culex quinquefasciatus]|eukprot:XP_001863276.1 DEAD box ATP-dependent RNA helicase [Culex quinquefasciatus]